MDSPTNLPILKLKPNFLKKPVQINPIGDTKENNLTPHAYLPENEEGNSPKLSDEESVISPVTCSGEGPNQLKTPPASNAEIILEFKIDGMTCVACSSTIENAMRSEFNDKGLKVV